MDRKGYKKLASRIEVKSYSPSAHAVARKMYIALRTKEKRGSLTKAEEAVLLALEF